MHKRRLRWNSHVSLPPRLELGKMWHGLNRNQGATGEHDGQYQMSTWTWVSPLARGRIDGIHHYNYRKTTFDHHHLSFDIPDMDRQVEESKFDKWHDAQFLEWSWIVRSLVPYNSNTPKGLIILILKMLRSEDVSKISLGCRWRYTKSPTLNCLTLGL
jgi:hypothetical protein